MNEGTGPKWDLLLRFSLLLDLARAAALRAVVALLGVLNAARMAARFATGLRLNAATGDLGGFVGGESNAGREERGSDDQ